MWISNRAPFLRLRHLLTRPDVDVEVSSDGRRKFRVKVPRETNHCGIKWSRVEGESESKLHSTQWSMQAKKEGRKALLLQK